MQETLFTIGAGPVDMYPEVRAAFTRPQPSDGDPAFLAFYQRVNEKLTRVLRSTTPATRSRPLISMVWISWAG